MSKKPDTASALAGILKAKRGDESRHQRPPATLPAEPEAAAPPPLPRCLLAPVDAPQPAPRRLAAAKAAIQTTASTAFTSAKTPARRSTGPWTTPITGQDFSELVQELLEQWLASRT